MRPLPFVMIASAIFFSTAAHADMDDTSGAIEAATALGKGAANFEACGVNTDRYLALFKEIARVCHASTSQRADILNAFLSARASARNDTEGLTCTWTREHAQRNFNDTIDITRSSIGLDTDDPDCR